MSEIVIKAKQTIFSCSSRRSISCALGIVSVAAIGGVVACGAEDGGYDDGQAWQEATPALAPRLDPLTIPKFKNQLQRFFTYSPTLIRDSRGKVIRKEYTVRIAKFFDQELPPPFPKTQLFGYGGNVKVGNCQFTDEAADVDSITTATESGCTTQFVRTSPGPKFEQTRLIPAVVRYRNELVGEHPLPVDPTLDWANPNNFPKPTPPFNPFPPGYPQAQSPIPHVTHTHGLEVTPQEDGLPDSWFTQNNIRGPEFVTRDYFQPSSNLPAAFWYHDHSFGVTRLDVGFGLSGFSILRDPRNPLDNPPPGTVPILPRGEFEVPLIIQDRSFRTDGSVFIPIAQTEPPGTIGAVPDVHPYWVLLNEGDTNVVNGRVWPNMNVKRQQYRFRILNSANQRFYDLKFSNNMNFTIIGGDGSFLPRPLTINHLLIGVTERADILVDFGQFPAGTKIVMQNVALRHDPLGPVADPRTDGTVMQFTVVDSPRVTPRPLPATLEPQPALVPDRPRRILIQNVQTDDQGRILQAELDGQLFHELTTELPTIGSTDEWDFVNTTPLTHNKHVHLIQFQVTQRRTFDFNQYLADWITVNGNPPFDHPTLKLAPEKYFTGPVMGPDPHETGWKDTVRTPAGMVTRIRIRWAQPDEPVGSALIGKNTFPINPLNSIGYIWHCHLLEHEDNEMMRPMTVIPIWKSGVSYPVGNRNSPGRQRGLVDFNGLNFQARVAHTSTNQTPPQRPDLWERINNLNGDWAIQTIYNVGDRVFFQGKVWRALQRHQARAGQEPNVAPTLWAFVVNIPPLGL